MAWFTQFVVRSLQKFGAGSSSRNAKHLALGKRGETEAFFHLQSLGYRFVATNFRVPHNRGEIDLIGWDNDVLCFIEVKTRTDASFAPPSTAVTGDKQRHIVSVARRYLRRLAGARPSCRFDILSIVPAATGGRPEMTLRKGPLPGMLTPHADVSIAISPIGTCGDVAEDKLLAATRPITPNAPDCFPADYKALP